VTRTLWAELAWLGGPAPAAGVVLRIEGDRVAGVETGASTPPPGAERRAGLTLPGLANAHSHAFQRALRGRTHAGTGSFWTWREQMYALAARLDPDAYLPLARAAFAEMALAGVTVVGEFHYVHHAPDGTPYADPNAMGAAVIAAADEAGVRLTLLDTCYLRGGFGEPPTEGQRRFADADADAWAARVDALPNGPAVRVGAAIHSVRAVDPGAAATVADWSAGRGAPLHAHVSEQPAENEACRDATGYTPTALLGEAGAVSDRFTAVHATHLDPADTAELGRTGARVCLCPTTERDLADGIADTSALRAAGIPLCLGSDSHAVIDLFEEARAVELDERLATGVRGGQTADALLAAATAHGYAALGWPDGGRIEAGALADLTTVSLGGVRLAGTRPENAVAAAVFAGAASDVTDVMVGGRDVIREGEHVRLDVARELAEAVGDLVAA
jgi:formiminoglutamate deiminase